MILHHILHGEARRGAVPLLVAHGLLGSARNWKAVAERLSDARAVIAVDMRNHGRSPWSDEHGYEAQAEDLAEAIAARAGGRAHVLGHSMGGKAAMALALARPERVASLIVVDIAPRPYPHAASQRALIEAMRGLDLDAVERRSDADARLARRVEDRAVRAFLLQSLDMAERRWRLNLDALDAQMDRITGWPASEGCYEGETLILRGGASDYVSREDEPAIRRLFPRARIEAIEGAGHWIHAEAPRPFEAAVRAALSP